MSIPREIIKPYGFLMFSRGVEIQQWNEMV